MVGLLDDEELAKLAALADTLRAIAARNAFDLAGQIDRLQALIANEPNHPDLAELAHRLNGGTELLDWGHALEEGDAVIDWLALRLADKVAEGQEEREELPPRPTQNPDATATKEIRLPDNLQIHVEDGNRALKHFAYTFRSELSLGDMLDRMNEQGPWHWRTGHHPVRGEYLSTTALLSGAMLKLFAEPEEPGYYFLKVSHPLSRPDVIDEIPRLRDVLIRRVLPAIRAVQLARSLSPGSE